jgi:hypothetical protein
MELPGLGERIRDDAFGWYTSQPDGHLTNADAYGDPDLENVIYPSS